MALAVVAEVEKWGELLDSLGSSIFIEQATRTGELRSRMEDGAINQSSYSDGEENSSQWLWVHV